MLTGGERFKIDHKIPYSDHYNECIKQAKSDHQKNIRRELTEYPDSIAEYDTIYLGYPNYWGTMPMGSIYVPREVRFLGQDDKAVLYSRGEYTIFKDTKLNPHYNSIA